MKSFILPFLFLLIILLFISCDREAAQTNFESQLLQGIDLNCDKEKIKTVIIFTELAKIKAPKDEPLLPTEIDKIHKLVERLKYKEDIIALAKISRAFRHSSGELECIRSSVIPTYDIAFWHCIRILAEDRSEENLRRMKMLKNELGIDGGDGYDWSTIVDRIPAP